MYYLEDLAGKITFKVKGVKVDVSMFTFEGIVELFLKKASIKFINQTQYRRVPKSEGTGVMIMQGLEKAYQLALDSKRKWVINRALDAYTTPLVLDMSTIASSIALKELPVSNIDMVLTQVKDMIKTTPSLPTKATEVAEGITQSLSFTENSIVITFPLEGVNQLFESA